MQAWYLLYCKGRKEKAAMMALEQRGVSCFLPEIRIDKIVKGKKTQVMQPLFPNYLFARFDPHLIPFSHVVNSPNVATVVRTNGQLQPVELGIVVMLRERLKVHQPVEDELPKKGEKVLITDGPLANVEAIFAEPDGDKRSVLLVNLLGKSQQVNMDNLGFQPLRNR